MNEEETEDTIPEYEEVEYDKEKDEYNYNSGYDDEENIELPDAAQSVMYKYQVEADVPTVQKQNLEPYRPFYGRHVSLGNTKRLDNIRFLDAYDLATILDECPTLRHRATSLKGRILAELQLCRSNPPVGGFERRMEATIIKQQDIDVKDNRFTPEPVEVRKKRFSLFRRKK